MLYVLENQGGREYQEDRHSVVFELYLDYDYFAVFDGHGGDQVSTFLKLYLKDILRSELEKAHTSSTEVNVLMCLFNAFQKMASLIPKEISMFTGSTALVILRRGKKVYVANAGDCRAIVNVGDNVVQITEDHKPATQKELERISKSGGQVLQAPMDVPRVNGMLAVSRSFGDFYVYPHVTWVPDIYSFDINPEVNYILAASDGLWDTLENQEVVSILSAAKGRDAFHNKHMIHQQVANMVNAARLRGSQDNITVLLLVF